MRPYAIAVASLAVLIAFIALLAHACDKPNEPGDTTQPVYEETTSVTNYENTLPPTGGVKL